MRRATLLALAALLLGAAPAQAGLERLDTSEYPRLTATLVTDRPLAQAPVLYENGAPVDGLLARNLGSCKRVLLAVDVSTSMRGAPLAHAVEGARRFVAAKPVCDRLAVMAIGPKAVLLSRFSTATIDADIALRTLGVSAQQGTALNDGVAAAARALRQGDDQGRVLVLLTDGNELGSKRTGDEALAEAKEAGVAVYVIAIESARFNPEPLRRLAEETGGAYQGAAGPAAVSAAYAAVARDLRRTWRLSWLTTARPGEQLELQAAGFTATGRLPGRATQPEEAFGPPEAYTSPLGAAAIGAAVGLLVLVALALVAGARRGSWVRKRLGPHVGRAAAGPRRSKERIVAGSALMALTERALGSLRLWRKAQRLLERADVPLRTAEFFWICFGAGLLLAFLTAASGQPSVFALGGLVLGAAVPYGTVVLRAKRRLRAFDNQLPDLLLTLAASLKAGHSFKQGIQSVVDEGLPPASDELRRVLTEVGLGRSLDDALKDMAARVGSENLDFVITAVTIQSQVGGSLAGLFDMVTEAVRQRQQFARKIRGLTAMGRASAYVLIAIPFGLAALLTMINREYMSALWSTSSGHLLVGMALGMMAVGSLLLKRIVSFKG